MERKKYTAEEIEKKFAGLPEEIKAFLYSAEMLDNIKKIGEKHKLHIDQVGLLEAETSEVMLGFTNTKDFPAVLEESLDIENQKAQLVAQDINDQLFVKIRDAMKRTYEQQKGEGEKQKVQSVPPPATSVPLAAPQIKTTPSAPQVTPTPPPPIAVPMPPLPPVATPAGQTPSGDSVGTSRPVEPPGGNPLGGAKPAAISPADLALSQKTISIPKTLPSTGAPQTNSTQPTSAKAEAPAGQSPLGGAKPPPYKADPYREPPE